MQEGRFKMKQEFNLSEKIGTFVHHGDEGTSCYCEAVIVPYIKEFIKLLKEGIHDFNETELGDKGRNRFIDKLAGEKLK